MAAIALTKNAPIRKRNGASESAGCADKVGRLSALFSMKIEWSFNCKINSQVWGAAALWRVKSPGIEEKNATMKANGKVRLIRRACDIDCGVQLIENKKNEVGFHRCVMGGMRFAGAGERSVSHGHR
ncbi:hypothetical protein [Achromobacter aegrifaciens]